MIVQDAVELLNAVQASVTGFDCGRVIWAKSIPERALMSLVKFPQPESCTESDGTKHRVSFNARLMYACADELDALWDEIKANGLPTDDLSASFVGVTFLLLALTSNHSPVSVKEFDQFILPLWELRQMLRVADLRAGSEGQGSDGLSELAPVTGGVPVAAESHDEAAGPPENCTASETVQPETATMTPVTPKAENSDVHTFRQWQTILMWAPSTWKRRRDEFPDYFTDVPGEHSCSIAKPQLELWLASAENRKKSPF